jgi:hypothetical protein
VFSVFFLYKFFDNLQNVAEGALRKTGIVAIVSPMRYFFLGENEEVVSPQVLCNISSNEHLKRPRKNLASIEWVK